jgi:hypothetical protein
VFKLGLPESDQNSAWFSQHKKVGDSNSFKEQILNRKRTMRPSLELNLKGGAAMNTFAHDISWNFMMILPGPSL